MNDSQTSVLTPGNADGVDVPGAPAAKLELMPSRQLPNWPAEEKLSLAFTTYQAGKMFLIGLQPNGRRRVFESLT
jgi:hypothetical protein